jgi:putative transposase
LLLDSLKAGFRDNGYVLNAWAILDNHYHIEFKVKEANMLSKIINQVHGRLSYLFNKMDDEPGRKIFQNYWDTCIREEKDLWTRFNYIHHNPVKHGYCKKMQDYSFSSFGYYLEEKGREWVDDCFSKYPIIDFMLKEETA